MNLCMYVCMYEIIIRLLSMLKGIMCGLNGLELSRNVMVRIQKYQGKKIRKMI